MTTRGAEKLLLGKRVLVTRPEGQAEAFARKLEELGAEPIVLPAIELLPPDDCGPVDQALRELAQGTYDWTVFTSANGVRFALERLQQLGMDIEVLKQVKIAAIGPATAQALQQHDIRVAFMPSQYVAEALADGLDTIQGQRILLLRADAARRDLLQRLQARGAHVEEVAVYRTRPARLEPERVWQLLRQGIDIVAFTSGSAVRALLDALGDQRALLNGVTVACIGPITACAAQDMGLPVHVVAGEHTIDGLIATIVEFSRRQVRG